MNLLDNVLVASTVFILFIVLIASGIIHFIQDYEREKLIIKHGYASYDSQIKGKLIWHDKNAKCIYYAAKEKCPKITQ